MSIMCTRALSASGSRLPGLQVYLRAHRDVGVLTSLLLRKLVVLLHVGRGAIVFCQRESPRKPRVAPKAARRAHVPPLQM